MRNRHLGDKASQRSDYKTARYYCELALKEAKGIGNKDLEGTACNNLGDANYFLGDLQKAIEVFQLSLNIAEKTGNKNSVGTAYNNLGLVYRYRGDLQKAIEFYQLSLYVSQKRLETKILRELHITTLAGPIKISVICRKQSSLFS